jgi:hypothetical protein
MPNLLRTHNICPRLIVLLLLLLSNPLSAKDFHGIQAYYVRLDHHFTAHKSTQTRVTMVPAENEPRAENFSLVLVEGIVSGDRQTADTTLANMARKETFARILEIHGLKSVKTLNQETIVSYEGVILSPADIAISTYDPARSGYPYTASVKFSPLSFPDQWESLKRQYSIKQILNDFFLLFK